MRIYYLSQMAIAATLSMGLVVGCGANPGAAKPGAATETTQKAAPCAAKTKPCAAKATPCAAKSSPCAAKK
jgi:hypothetical protein